MLGWGHQAKAHLEIAGPHKPGAIRVAEAGDCQAL